MDKKLLVTFGEELVAEVAKAHGIEPGEARALVLIVLKKNKERLVEATGATPKAAEALPLAKVA